MLVGGTPTRNLQRPRMTLRLQTLASQRRRRRTRYWHLALLFIDPPVAILIRWRKGSHLPPNWPHDLRRSVVVTKLSCRALAWLRRQKRECPRKIHLDALRMAPGNRDDGKRHEGRAVHGQLPAGRLPRRARRPPGILLQQIPNHQARPLAECLVAPASAAPASRQWQRTGISTPDRATPSTGTALSKLPRPRW